MHAGAMADIVVIPSTDTALIAALHHATVTVAYRGFFPDSNSPPTVAELRGIWTARLTHPGASALIAWCGGRPVGSVMARTAPQYGEGEIVGLHVLPSEWGKRIGSTLLTSALDVLREAGNRSAGLWVLAANLRARRMYERRGWVLCPGVEQKAYGVSEVRYQRDLL
jgi:GNAT superfamily N-acetyltransferase